MINRWLQTRIGDVQYSGREAKVNCPFCGDDGHHLYMNMAKPIAHCFRCEWAGTYIGLIMKVEDCNYAEALSYIEKPLPDISRFDDVTQPEDMEEREVRSPAPDGFIPLFSRKYHIGDEWNSLIEANAVWRYLVKRNVPDDLIRSGRFGWVSGTNRVWILVDDRWWQGRLIIPGRPRYLSPPWSKGNSLWNAMALRPGKGVVICEGVFSAIAVGPHAVATCAKTMTRAQAARVVKYDPSYVVIMLDAGAEEESYYMANILTNVGYDGAIFIQFMESGDPADGVVGELVQWSWDARMKHSLTTINT